MGRYSEIYPTLSDGEKARSDMLRSALTELGVADGMQDKLQCYGHFGILGDPIWQYIYKLRTSRKGIRDKGSWLCKCLERHYQGTNYNKT